MFKGTNVRARLSALYHGTSVMQPVFSKVSSNVARKRCDDSSVL